MKEILGEKKEKKKLNLKTAVIMEQRGSFENGGPPEEFLQCPVRFLWLNYLTT